MIAISLISLFACKSMVIAAGETCILKHRDKTPCCTHVLNHVMVQAIAWWPLFLQRLWCHATWWWLSHLWWWLAQLVDCTTVQRWMITEELYYSMKNCTIQFHSSALVVHHWILIINHLTMCTINHHSPFVSNSFVHDQRLVGHCAAELSEIPRTGVVRRKLRVLPNPRWQIKGDPGAKMGGRTRTNGRVGGRWVVGKWQVRK